MFPLTCSYSLIVVYLSTHISSYRTLKIYITYNQDIYLFFFLKLLNGFLRFILFFSLTLCSIPPPSQDTNQHPCCQCYHVEMILEGAVPMAWLTVPVAPLLDDSLECPSVSCCPSLELTMCSSLWPRCFCLLSCGCVLLLVLSPEPDTLRRGHM